MWVKVISFEFLLLLRSPPYCVSLFTNSFNFPPIFIKLRRVYHGNMGGDLRWLVPPPLDSFRRNGLTYRLWPYGGRTQIEAGGQSSKSVIETGSGIFTLALFSI